MITGAHSIIYSKDAEVDRNFLRDASSSATSTSATARSSSGCRRRASREKNDEHEFYLMCDDIEAFVAEMKEHKISCEPVNDQGWGLLSQLHLPGGGKLGVYQARHARPEPM